MTDEKQITEAWLKEHRDELLSLLGHPDRTPVDKPAGLFDLLVARPDLDQLPFIGLKYDNGARVLITPRWLRELGHGTATELIFGLMGEGHVELISPEFEEDGTLMMTFKVLPTFFMPDNAHRFSVPDHLLLHFPGDDWGQA